MLVKHTPDAYEKLQILGSMQVAGDDVLSRPESGGVGNLHFEPKRFSTSGVYQAKMPNGKRINLMRVMFTDFCKMDCQFLVPTSTHGHTPRSRNCLTPYSLSYIILEPTMSLCCPSAEWLLYI